MNSIYAVADVFRISRAAIITFASAFALITMTGCFGSPRANDTFAGAAIGAGGGALIGGAEGSPGAGALIGGLGGGAIGYIVGTETENNNRYYGRGYGYYPGGY
jgi:osmotically inducible lipoprotein OsmB